MFIMCFPSLFRGQFQQIICHYVKMMFFFSWIVMHCELNTCLRRIRLWSGLFTWLKQTTKSQKVHSWHILSRRRNNLAERIRTSMIVYKKYSCISIRCIEFCSFYSLKYFFASNINGGSYLRMIKPDLQDAIMSSRMIWRLWAKIAQDMIFRAFGGLRSVATARKLRKYKWRKKYFL